MIAQILRHFPDPNDPVRVVVRALVHGRMDRELCADAKRLATALDMPHGRTRDDAIAWAREALLTTAEERGIVPVDYGPSILVLRQ